MPLKGLSLFLVSLSLSLSTFMYVLDYSIANVSIPHIVGDLASSNEQGTYIITAFAVGNAACLPLTGWLSKNFGSVKIHVLATLLFTFFSWLCGVSLNYQMLILSRFFQGVSAGPIIPLSQTLLLQIFHPKKKSTAMALFGNVAIVGPVIGPVLGGWITFNYSWPWIFYINIPVGIFSAIITWHFLKNQTPSIEKVALDKIGLFLLVIAVTSLQIFLDKGEQCGWFQSNLIRTLSITSLISFSFFIAWELYTSNALLDLKLFKISTFAISIIILVAIYGIYFGTMVLIPLWLQTYMNYNATWAGLAIAPLGIAPLLFSAFLGKLISRFGCTRLIALCCIFFAFACFYTAYFNTDVNFLKIAFSRFLIGIGILFFISPILTLSIQNILPEHLPNSTSLFHFLRTLFAGIGTSIFITFWIRRGIFHHSNLISWITPSDSNANQMLNQMHHLGLDHHSSLAMMNQIIDQQAYTLSQNDVSFLMGWLCLSLILLLPLAREKSSSQKNLFQNAGFH